MIMFYTTYNVKLFSRIIYFLSRLSGCVNTVLYVEPAYTCLEGIAYWLKL